MRLNDIVIRYRYTFYRVKSILATYKCIFFFFLNTNYGISKLSDWLNSIIYDTLLLFDDKKKKKKCISIVEQFFSILQKNHQRFISEYVPSLSFHRLNAIKLPYVSESRLKRINNWISIERTVLIRVRILISKEKKIFYLRFESPTRVEPIKQTNKQTNIPEIVIEKQSKPTPIPQERGPRNTFSHSESSGMTSPADRTNERPSPSNRWKKSLHLGLDS